jgi:cytochrome c oxidase subunit 4
LAAKGKAMQDLLVLSHEDFTQLRGELKTAGLDVCYTTQSARPIYRRWSSAGVHDVALLQQVARRRPTDASYRLASVRCTRPGNWFWPDRLSVTFHAVGATQDRALQEYLGSHPRYRQAQSRQESAGEAHLHTTPATYVQVALLLALITAFEVALLYFPEGLRPPRRAVLLVLVLLSILKFGMVVSFFMHLRYDHRLYAGLFVGGMIVAAGTVLALLALFREPSAAALPATATPTITAPPTLPAAVSARPGKTTGGQIFVRYGCGGCHTVAHMPTARGTLGPGLDDLAQRAARRIPGVPADDYIRQAVAAPGAYVVKGYFNLMPPLREQMHPQEFAVLLSWLLTL